MMAEKEVIDERQALHTAAGGGSPCERQVNESSRGSILWLSLRSSTLAVCRLLFCGFSIRVIARNLTCSSYFAGHDSKMKGPSRTERPLCVLKSKVTY